MNNKLTNRSSHLPGSCSSKSTRTAWEGDGQGAALNEYDSCENSVIMPVVLISTNERGDNIQPMRRGDYFTIFESCLRPASFLGGHSRSPCIWLILMYSYSYSVYRQFVQG